MKTKIFKQIGLSILSVFIISGVVYAASMTDLSSEPGSGNTVGLGWYQGVKNALTNVCGDGKILKGFSSTGSQICVVQPTGGQNTDYFNGTCDTPNITIQTGSITQVWSACNVGTSVAGASISSYGNYYTYPSAVAICPDGWHLPSIEEWQTALSKYNNNDISNSNNLAYKLQLPIAGYYLANENSLGMGYYFAYSPTTSSYLLNQTTDNPYYLKFTTYVIFQPSQDSSVNGTVRCLKN